MQPQSMTEFLNDRVSELDSSLTSYFSTLAAEAGQGASNLPGLQTTMDYIENALLRKGIYEDLLAGIKAGYIIADLPLNSLGAQLTDSHNPLVPGSGLKGL